MRRPYVSPWRLTPAGGVDTDIDIDNDIDIDVENIVRVLLWRCTLVLVRSPVASGVLQPRAVVLYNTAACCCFQVLLANILSECAHSSSLALPVAHFFFFCIW